MLKYTAKVFTVATLSLTCANGEETTANEACEGVWCLAGKYAANLSHIGCFADGTCDGQTTPYFQKSSAFDGHLLMMSKWLEELGGELNKAWMHEFSPTNKGMVATDNIKEGELIAFIPRSMLVT